MINDNFEFRKLTIFDVARICQVSPDTVREWCNVGKLTCLHDTSPTGKKTNYKILLIHLCDFASKYKNRAYYMRVAKYVYGEWIKSMASKSDVTSEMLYSIYIRQANRYAPNIDIPALEENFKVLKEWYNSAEAFTRIITFTGVEENLNLLEFGEDK